MGALDKLLAIASPAPIGAPSEYDLQRCLGKHGALAELLMRRNGFYAFESALHLRSFTMGEFGHGIIEWNEPSLWRDQYTNLESGLVFFAEDVFGTQFGMMDEKVYTFEPETGEVSHFAHSLENWAHQTLADYQFLTGQPLAHEWQTINGRIEDGCRLVPMRPFVLGGEYAVSNLRSVVDVLGMKWRAKLARQIHGMADGTCLRYRLGEPGHD